MISIFPSQLAPSLPLQEDFVYHWKAITHYYIETSGKSESRESAHDISRGRIFMKVEVVNVSFTSDTSLNLEYNGRMLGLFIGGLCSLKVII